jgi:hypothetical protein
VTLTITVGITTADPKVTVRLVPNGAKNRRIDHAYKYAFTKAQELVDNTRYEQVKLYVCPEDEPELVAGVVLGFASKGIPCTLHHAGEESHIVYPGVEMWTMTRLTRVECG